MNPADERTREYLLQLMRDVPTELAEEVEEIRRISERLSSEVFSAQADAEKLRMDVQRLVERASMLERRVQDLCDTAQKAVAIGPLMDMLREDEQEGGGDGP